VVVVENVNQTVTVHQLKNVNNSNVLLYAGKELVVRIQTVLPGTIVLIALVHLISWEMPEQDVTQNVPDMMNALTTKLVSNLLAKILAENLIQMCVEVVPTVK